MKANSHSFNAPRQSFGFMCLGQNERFISCPDCGFVFDGDENNDHRQLLAAIRKTGYFACLRCDARMPATEFFELNADKYSKQADLSNE